MPKSPPLHVVAMATAVTFALSISACGGGGSTAAESSDDSMGPLAELLGWEAETPEESRRKQLEVEELIAECMRADGWEYVPVDHAAQMPDDEMSELGADPEAFGERYGYGVVQSYEQWDEPYLLGEEMDDGGQMMEDPNMEYVHQLSESEMTAYYETLYGSMSFDDGSWDDAGEDGGFETDTAMSQDHGCQGVASEQVYGADPVWSDPDLVQRLEDYWMASLNDPRLIDAHDQWASCMADHLADAAAAGTSIVKPEQMYQHLEQLKYEAMGLQIVPYRDGDDIEEGFYSSWVDETGRGTAAVGEPRAIDGADLERLRTTELELWKRDQACQDDAGVVDVMERIEADLVAELRRDFPELGSGS
jgi:hypothetical protein